MSSEPPSHDFKLDKLWHKDAELFRLLRGGQKKALAILYDRHATLVYGIALKLLDNTQEAEDLTQDIFLTLKECPYNPKRGTLRTYLAILTRSRAFDLLRTRTRDRKRLRKQIINERDRVMSDNSMEALFSVERSQEVQAALALLSSQERQVLEMMYYQGLSQSETALRLDVPIGTVKSRSRRGLLKLRQALTDVVEKS